MMNFFSSKCKFCYSPVKWLKHLGWRSWVGGVIGSGDTQCYKYRVSQLSGSARPLENDQDHWKMTRTTWK